MRVLLADDHRLVRAALRSLLESRGVEVVAEAANGCEAVEQARLHRPDVVVMDVSMPIMNGLIATRRMAAELPDVKVVMLTASEGDADLFDAIKSGADGYLLKDTDPEEFFALLSGVTDGVPAVPPLLAQKILREFSRVNATVSAADELTERERDVLRLLVHGVSSNRALAKQLGVSENTVRYHLRNIMDKLHLHSRTQAVAYAIRHGLVEE